MANLDTKQINYHLDKIDQHILDQIKGKIFTEEVKQQTIKNLWYYLNVTYFTNSNKRIMRLSPEIRVCDEEMDIIEIDENGFICINKDTWCVIFDLNKYYDHISIIDIIKDHITQLDTYK
ncbi:hypothetical protein AV926_11810 [Myroides marinus]|uniref:Uncharacterized protein n=1 Tax=Myroides marinus TaxID=703342 RepID=A0A161SEY7_9FLAO|nr:hypothetical protein [Myroides marinus]KUF38934.1 hypothetical protein AS361_03555 [Myroides marinus]KZE79495.1 hypothetical protein AV926_11810 [Myroides marinus]